MLDKGKRKSSPEEENIGAVLLSKLKKNRRWNVVHEEGEKGQKEGKRSWEEEKKEQERAIAQTSLHSNKNDVTKINTIQDKELGTSPTRDV